MIVQKDVEKEINNNFIKPMEELHNAYIICEKAPLLQNDVIVINKTRPPDI